jgi:RHS repeat-associated protein
LRSTQTHELIGSTSYDAYGNRTNHTGTTDSAIGYTGNWTDATTGLVYLRARDYDPATAQFLTVDPAVDETRQPYTYVANNPLLATDPTGLCLFARSNGRCRGGGILDTVVLNGPSAHTLQTGVLGAIITTFEGIGDGASFGLTQQARDAIDPGAECFVNKNGFYYGGIVTGAIATTVITAGAGESAAAARTATGAAQRAATVAETGGSAADKAAYDYATSTAKLNHVFADKHNFDPLVQQFGSREAVAQQFLNGLKGLTPASGTFEQQIVVGGQKVMVRGAVVDGVTKIGTAFTQ